MLSSYTPKDLKYFMDNFPEVKNLIASGDYISGCNFSMNFFPVVLNADHEVGMSMKAPVSAYFIASKNQCSGIVLHKTINYDNFHDKALEYPRDRYNYNLDQLSIYITDYLTKHNVSTDWNLSIFMCRDRHTGFGYKLFWAVQLVWWLMNTT